MHTGSTASCNSDVHRRVQVQDKTPFMEAGMDSLGAVELRNALSERLAVTLPATAAFDYPTIAAMATFISSQTAPMSQQAAQAVMSMQPTLSKEQVEAQVAEAVKELLGPEIEMNQVRTAVDAFTSG